MNSKEAHQQLESACVDKGVFFHIYVDEKHDFVTYYVTSSSCQLTNPSDFPLAVLAKFKLAGRVYRDSLTERLLIQKLIGLAECVRDEL